MTPDLVGQAKAYLSTRPAMGGVGVVGDVCIDRFVFGTVDRISPEAPVPVLRIERRSDKPGCAANVAENLAALRPELQFALSLVGVTGTDAAGESLRQLLGRPEAGIDAHILRDATRPTTLKMRFIAGSQHQLLRVDEESTHTLNDSVAENILKEIESLLPRLKCLVVQDYAKGVFSEKILHEVLSLARRQGVLALVDPNPHTPGSFYRGAGLITPNIIEAEVLLGRSLHRGGDDREIADACRELKKKLALDMAIITRSGHGMTLIDQKDDVHHFPALARAVFDVTGAGDTVVAVMAAAFAGQASPSVACTLATAAASVVVGKVGTATASVPEILKELEEFSAPQYGVRR